MSILKSSYPSLDIPEDVSFSQLLLREAAKCPEKLAMINDVTGEQITYGLLEKKIRSLACALYERGLRKGDIVCLHADKTIIGIIAFYATVEIRAVITPSRTAYKVGELARQVNCSDTKIVISDANLMQTTLAAIEKAPTVEKVYTIGPYDGYESIQDLISRADANNNKIEVSVNPREDAAVIIYSSGTTGVPKGIVLSHYAMVAETKIFQSRNLIYGETFFQNASQFHIAGLNLMSAYLTTRNLLVLTSPKSVTELLERAKKYQVKSMLCLPHFLTELSKLSDEDIKKLGVNFSDITFLTGGSMFNATNTNEVISKTGVKAIVQIFGSTEVTGFASFDSVVDPVPGSAGKVAPNTEMKIVHLTSREILGANQQGEIRIKGPTSMIGYYKNPEATKDVFDEDGFVNTGDIGYYDETGQIFITGRLKDILKYKTTPVFPSEIEEVIYTHPAVRSVCVIGVEDDKVGEVPLACVIVKDDHSVTEQEIAQLVEDSLADYKRLRGGVKFVKEFPRTSLGKIIRREVTEMIKHSL